MSRFARGRAAAPWLLAALFYVALTLFETWPLATHLADVLPNDLGDPVLNAWIVWWNAHAVPLTARWWNAPAFWPSTGAFAFSEALLGLTPITTPIQWLGGSAITAYNVAFLLTFPLSAIAAHALEYRLTGRHDAGVIAGLVYGFNPFRIAHFPQIQVMTSYWMPLALLALHAFVTTERRRWLWLFGAAWLMQALSNGYYLLFFPVLLGLWMLWFAGARSSAPAFKAMAIAFVVASLPLIPLLWGYYRIHAAFAFQRHFGEIGNYSADVLSLLDASPLLKFWHLHSFHQPEGELFPGLTAAALALVVSIGWMWRTRRVMTAPWPARLLLAGAAVFIGVGVSALVIGPWSIAIGDLTLMSVRMVGKPLSVGMTLLVLAIAVSLASPVSGGWRRRSPLMFYTLATVLMYLLAFGPQPHLLGAPLMWRGPYRLLMALPGYDAVRVPARFAMLAALCIAVVAAMAFARLTAPAGRLVRLAAAVVVICGVIFDSAIGEMPLKALPVRLHALESLPPDAAVLELPLGAVNDDLAAMYRGMYHHRPVVNGYSGFFPGSFEVLRRGLDSRDPQLFDAVALWGPLVVMVDTARDPGAVWVKQLEQRPGTTALGGEAGWRAFSLPRAGHPPHLDVSQRLTIEAVAANVNNDRMPFAVDGRADTAWDSGPQQGTEVITIDLGGEYDVDAVAMTIGAHVWEFPQRLAIESSSDKRTWTTQWDGGGGAIAFAAAVRDPREVPLTFGLPRIAARWLRLKQLGPGSAYPWTIFELSVYGR